MSARDFLDVVLGECRGFVAMAFAYGGHADAAGRYTHTDRTERRYVWPDNRDVLLTDVRLADAVGADVYLCPALRCHDRRVKGDAVGPTVVWADLDHTPTGDAAVLRDKLNGPVVASGSPGHQHIYARLNRPVDPAMWRRLAVGLRDGLGADHKITDNDLLRLPDTHTHKGDEPTLVTLERSGERVWAPDELAELLGVNLTGPDASAGLVAPLSSAEPAPDPLPPGVLAALEHPDVADRSAAHQRVVGACRWAGLTPGQALTVVSDYGPSIEKYKGRLAEETVRSWGKSIPSPDEGWAALGMDVSTLPLPTPGVNGQGPSSGHTAPLNLPEGFWSARPALAHIRAAAHARCVSADVVFHATLARIASLVGHRTRIDTGIVAPASLNVFTAAIGASGTSKTSAVAVARELVTPPRLMVMNDGYRDGLPLGSGEGLAELYMGQVTEPTGEEIKSGPFKGQPKTRSVRRQVRANAYLLVDEGESLLRMMERSGATIGPALRSAWVAETLGQSNASEDRTRVIERGSYALGLVVGLQPGTAGALFSEAAGGTPQRLLYCSAPDPSIPDEPVSWPGPLCGVLEAVPQRPDDGPRTIELGCPETRARLRAAHLARHRGGGVAADPLDAHAPLHLAKIAALLALLDRRAQVTRGDWELAEQVWQTSCAVRTALIEYGREVERARAETRTVAHVEREERAALARDQVGGKVARIAARLAEWVRAGEHTRGALRRGLPSRDRNLYDDAVDHAVTAGWVRPTSVGLEPGQASP